MEKPKFTLDAWRKRAPQRVRCNLIATESGLQPREQRLAPVRDWAKMEATSDEHVAIMRGRLAGDGAADLEPVLVARVGERLLLVDGHHRLRAYRAERRETIPARVLTVTLEQAVMASKLANLDGAKLPMHNEQRRDAAWQYLALVTLRGALGLPAGESLRTIGARFGIAHNTVRAMLERLPEVDPSQFGPEACDPGTGWPRWRFLRESSWKGGLEVMQPEQKLRWQAERMAAKLARVMEGADLDVIRLAVRFLALEGKDAETLRGIESLCGDESADF